MAIDNTPPRLKLIITIAVITVITLVGIDFVLRGYYAYMSDEAQRLKLAPTTALNEHHAAEKAALAGAAMPIDQAMAQLAKGTRTDLVTPQPSDDLGPMTGWSKLPKPAPTAGPQGAAIAVPPTGHEPVMTGDAGALPPHDHAMHAGAADAGPPKPAPRAADGGAPKPAPRAPADGGAPKPAPRAPAKDAGQP
jgi:hypothetical protein